jgi:transposase-like protein
MEAEVSELIGAERGERSEDRLTHRNGYRSRSWSTRAGELELAIPKLRRGSYFPSFLAPRKRSEQALVSVVQEAYVAGVSTRKVDQVVESLFADLEERGLADLRRPRRAGRGVPPPSARGPLSLPVAGREGGEGP